MKIFVGCSSRDEIDASYFELAKMTGLYLQQHELVIGGTCVGMMGAVAHTFPKEKITQIILKDYVKEGVQETENFYVCDTSFERMNLIWNSSDAFLFLPGGTGTLGEMISFLEENRTLSKRKKLYVFNYQHFFDDIIAFIEKAKLEKFSNEEILEGFVFLESLKELEEIL